MRTLSQHPRARLVAPVLVAAVGAGGVAATGATAGSSGDLEPRTAQQLLTALATARPTPLSGEVRQSMDLGLPALPTGTLPTSGTGLDLFSLTSGTHTWRVWYADPQHARAALVSRSGELNVVRNDTDLWTWSSTAREATRTTLPAKVHGTNHGIPDHHVQGHHMPATSSPDAAAREVLRLLDPSTAVTTTSHEKVAGRPAYGLVLTPKTSGTLVGSVRVALDAATSLPLAVTVTPRGSDRPAVDVRYTSLDLGRPDASVFRFAPPPGTTVTRNVVPSPHESRSAGEQVRRRLAERHTPGRPVMPAQPPRVEGTGWSTVVTGRLPQPARPDAEQRAMLDRVLPPVSGPWGQGRVLRTRLVSAVLTDDGRYAVGMVPVSLVYHALGH